MIIDDAERIERRMRLVDNEDDAFEYATLVAEGAARVLQNARIRGSMRKFAYKLIAYKGGVLDAALEEERAAIERELIAVDDEFGAAVYDEFLEAVNRCEEMWCPAKPHFVTIENKTTCTPALFLAMDARERIHEVAAELDRQYPRPAETSYVLADELRMFVEIAARHALKRAGVDVPKKHRGARVALRRFIARAKEAASRLVERLVRNPDDPDGQTMNAFMDALFGDVAAMLRIEGATHRSAKSRAASARRWVANEVNAWWVRERGRDVGAGEAVRVDAFLRALVQSFDGNVRMFIARWTSLRDFARIARPSSNVRRLRREGSLSVTMAGRRRRLLERTHRSRVKRAQPARGGSPYEHMAARQIQTKVRILLPTPIPQFLRDQQNLLHVARKRHCHDGRRWCDLLLARRGSASRQRATAGVHQIRSRCRLKKRVQRAESAEGLLIRSIHSGWPASDGVRVSSE